MVAAAGLVLLTGPFTCTAWAVDYVDQETRKAELAQTAPDDPYAPRGPQAYPTTSFGAGTPPAPAAPAPAAPAATPGAPAYAPAPAPVNAVAPAAAPVAVQPVMQQPQDSNLGALFMQIQQLQQQIMLINGKLEEQANELRTLQEQSLQRYVDLDRRLGGAGAAGAAIAPSAPAAASAPSVAPSVPGAAPAPVATAPGPVAAPPAAAQPGEAEAYRAAYALVQSQKFAPAVQAFQQFQRDYPAGTFAANAYYWLGELYLVVQPPDLEASRQAFTMLLSQYPDNSKAPDALYKLGKVQFMKGNREKAKEYLDQVISRYGSTNSSAVKLAKDFLAENY